MIIFNEKISNILDPSDPKATTGMDLIKCNFQCVFGHLSAQFTVHPMLRRIYVCACVGCDKGAWHCHLVGFYVCLIVGDALRFMLIYDLIKCNADRKMSHARGIGAFRGLRSAI